MTPKFSRITADTVDKKKNTLLYLGVQPSDTLWYFAYACHRASQYNKYLRTVSQLVGSWLKSLDHSS